MHSSLLHTHIAHCTATPWCANMIVDTGKCVPFNFNKSNNRVASSILHVSSRLHVHMVVCFSLSVFKIRAKSRKKGIVATKFFDPLYFAHFTTNTINAKFIQARALKKHNMVPQLYCDHLFIQRAFLLLWLSYATRHWNVHFMSLISMNVKHLSLTEPNPSDDFFPPHSNGNGACDKTVVLT